MGRLANTLKYSFVAYLGVAAQNRLMNYQIMEPSVPESEEFQRFIAQEGLSEATGYVNYRQYSQAHYTENILHRRLGLFSLYGIYFKSPVAKKITGFQSLDEAEKEDCELFCFLSTGGESLAEAGDGEVHHGVTNAVLDSLMAQLSAIHSDYSPVATAFIDHQYVQPLCPGQEYLLRVKISRRDKRKVFVEATILDPGMETHFRSQALFLQVNWANYYWDCLRKLLQVKSTLVG